ncbi:MAG: RQC domain-containing protein, partial [Pirellulales bacterium]
LYSPGDFATWRKMQSELPPPAFKAAMELLTGIDRFCTTAACRHATIMKYFGQTPAAGSCGACDICLDEVELVDEPLIVGQKILSCVVRLEQNFGVYHTAKVLTGSQEQRIVDLGHQRLSTYGILGDQTVKEVGAWIDQLIDQQFLERVGEYNVLKLTAAGGELLRGERTPRLTRPVKASKEAKVSRESWEGVDRELFESLRKLRREIADAKGLPPFVVFSDATLRDLARRRPSSREKLLAAHGVGDKKADQYGEPFLNRIREHCLAHDLSLDAAEEVPQPAPPPPLPVAQPNEIKRQAMARLAEGESIEQVCETTGRARSTVVGYLIEAIREHGICDATVWVDEATAERVRAAARQVGASPLRPIFLALDEQVGYEQIKITVACLENEPPE